MFVAIYARQMELADGTGFRQKSNLCILSNAEQRL